MGYFPLPELKGKPNRIFVDGKTLNGRILEGCRYEFDTNRWMYGLYQIPNTQIVKWFYMEEENIEV